MTFSLRKIIRFFFFLLMPIVMFGSYAVLFYIPQIGYLNLERLGFYGALLFFALYFWKNKSITLHFGASFPYALFFAVLLLYASASLLWTKSMTASYAAYYYIFWGVFIVLFVTLAAGNFSDLKLFLRIVTACTIITILIGMAEIFTGHYFFTQNRNALFYKNAYGLHFPYSTFYNMNDYSAFVVLFTPMAVLQILNDSKGLAGKLLAGLTAAAGLFTVLNANARICYFAIAVFAVAFVAALAGKPAERKYVRPILIAAAAVFFVFLLLWLTSVIHLHVFGKELASINSGDHSIQERSTLFQAGLSMLKDYHWLGVGIGNSVVLVPYYSDLQPVNLHGMPLQILVEYGIIIFALYVLMLLALGIRLFRFNGGNARQRIWSCVCFASLCSFQLADFASSDATHVIELWIVIAIWVVSVKLLYQHPQDVAGLQDVDELGEKKCQEYY